MYGVGILLLPAVVAICSRVYARVLEYVSGSSKPPSLDILPDKLPDELLLPPEDEFSFPDCMPGSTIDKKNSFARRPSSSYRSGSSTQMSPDSSPKSVPVDSTKFAEHNMIAALTPSARLELFEHASQSIFPVGTVLMQEGHPSDCIWFINRGTVSISKAGVEIAQQSEGGLLGEMGVMLNKPRTATVTCVTEVEGIYISREAFVGVLDHNPEVYRIMLKEMLGKFQDAQDVRVQQTHVIQDAIDILTRTVNVEVLNLLDKETSPEDLLKGRTNQAAILFYDIRGFSAAAEFLPPQTLLSALNDHLQLITLGVEQFSGSIVNFIGDAVLGAFNTPIPIPEPAIAALRCYLKIKKMLVESSKKRKELNKITFSIGAGINFGEVVAGAIGSERRFSYSILGDEVNLAARLESLTRHYPVDVIFSESFVLQLPQEYQDQLLELDYASVKGRMAPVRLFTLKEDSGVVDVEAFDAARKLYLQGNFGEAHELFAAMDYPLAHFFRDRCADLMSKDKQWTGYFVWGVK